VSEYKVVNPATNQTEREFPTATDAEVQQVLQRSARAFQSWRTTAKDERAKILLRVAELYKERVDDLATLITREIGKPTREAKGEIYLVASWPILRRSGSAAPSTARTPSKPGKSPACSTPAWCGSATRRARWPACRSAAPSAPASAGN
jgi:succinate-semialdehyde dehydrogenase / glutarate-semialdehyde dehydrogenase